MTEAPQILLNHRLKSLRLPTVLREYGKLAKQAAAEGLDHVQFLARLIELEMPGGLRRQSSFAGVRPRPGTPHDRAQDQGRQIPSRQKPGQL